MIGDDLIEQKLWAGRVKRRRRIAAVFRGLFVFLVFFGALQLTFLFVLDAVATVATGHPLLLSPSEWVHVFVAAVVTGGVGSIVVGGVVLLAVRGSPEPSRSAYLERLSTAAFGGVVSRAEYRKLVADAAAQATQMATTPELGFVLEQAVDDAVGGESTRKDRTSVAACWDVLRHGAHTPDFERAMADADDWQDLLYEMARQVYREDVREAAKARRSG